MTSWLAMPGIALLANLAACATGPSDGGTGPITGSAPRQVMLRSDPSIERHPNPDSTLLVAVVGVFDSTLHRAWQPSQILVESDRGAHRVDLIAPTYCLLPEGGGLPFPRDFTWWSCYGTGINTDRLLTPSRVREIETLIGGRLSEFLAFQTMPGGFYGFSGVIGEAATAEAQRRLSTLSEVTAAYRIEQTPFCILSDVVPPPPCPPWELALRIPFSFGPTPGGDTVAVSPTGWVRVTYTQLNGVSRTAQYNFGIP